MQLNIFFFFFNKKRHSLPDSPPDSSSEHPYSPQENCEGNLNNSDTIYTTLGQPLYKPNLLNPIITDNLILGSHIVVTEQNNDNQLLENGNLLQDRLLDSQNLLNGRLITENLQNEQNLILTDNNIQENNRQILIQSPNDSSQQGYVENCPRTDPNLIRRNPNDILLVKNGDYDKSQLVHLGFNPNIEMQIPRTNIETNICNPTNIENIAVYTNLQNAPKKRKLSQDIPLVKSEPGIYS